MLISESSRFQGAVWQTYARDVPLRLAAGASSPWDAAVYAKVRDASGNESIVDVDGIRVTAPSGEDVICTCSLPGRGRGLPPRVLLGLALAFSGLLRRRRRTAGGVKKP